MQAMSTTMDTDVRLVDLTVDAAGEGALAARMTFISHQSPGFGPVARPAETCTRCDVTYALSFVSDRYLIKRSTKGPAAAQSSPC